MSEIQRDQVVEWLIRETQRYSRLSEISKELGLDSVSAVHARLSDDTADVIQILDGINRAESDLQETLTLAFSNGSKEQERPIEKEQERSIEEERPTVSIGHGKSTGPGNLPLRRDWDNHPTKLKPDQVIAIRQEYAKKNISYTDLAKKYNVTPGQIRLIVLNKSWAKMPRRVERQQPVKIFTRSGARNIHAKLTEDQVREIRSEKEKGVSIQDLAAYYGVSTSNISFICKRVTWKHVV